MAKDKLVPDYIFESSWEVCNKVGGIYTVLSSRAKTLQNAAPDRIIFIGTLLKMILYSQNGGLRLVKRA